jgi:hypothetical protein
LIVNDFARAGKRVAMDGLYRAYRLQNAALFFRLRSGRAGRYPRTFTPCLPPTL